MQSFGPTVAGHFYPDNPKVLEPMVRGFLDQASEAASLVPPERRPVAVISPHAGYVYSGSVAGYAFAAVSKRDIHTVIVLGPSHHGQRSKACTLSSARYHTPIGDVPLAQDLIQELVRQGPELVQIDPYLFVPEHSVDVQIPFVKEALPQAKLIPLIVPFMPKARIEALGDLLFKVFGSDPHTLLVASSDLSHFFDYNQARLLDEQILREIEQDKTDSLWDLHDERRGPCGVAPILATLQYAHHFTNDPRCARLKVQNSGDTPEGDHHRVVGYSAVALSIKQ